MYTFIYESGLVVFKYFLVSLAACVINFHLEHSFYIDVVKNIISYFNTLKILFFFFCQSHFLYIFEKRIEDRWLGLGLGRYAR